MREFPSKATSKALGKRGTRKRDLGATEVGQTPLAIRSDGVMLSPDFKRYVRRSLGNKLGKFANRIERLTARFRDINGPRGGVDIACKVKVVLSSLPSIIVEERAEAERPAFDAVTESVTRAVRKSLDRARLPRREMARKAKERRDYETGPEIDPGSFIGRRVGRGPENLEAVKRAGAGSTARRNVKARTRRATATLEDSRKSRPSRKSTRKSANRAKSGNKLQVRAVRKARSPKRRATKAMAQNRGGR